MFDIIAVRTLLKRLEEELPPPPLCHHALTFAQYGSDKKGWEDKLAVQINFGGVFKCFFIENADQEKHVYEVIDEIVNLVKANNPRDQIGVGPGQYVERDSSEELTPHSEYIDSKREVE